MIVPNVISFPDRTDNWLEVLREIRIKITTKKQVDKDDKMMKQMLSLMSKEQMAGYLKGLIK